ncbi:VOC family protein [Cohnella thailandensis]|uniref:VOC family protein n=1 Tax=Cohnella thailandensis TaxID=557557 RepID=A0A841T3X1_9BACL|nr:VOC family protein [Cohnella thailandensis]MBB6637536.1 VOC family protein [Cohnella thailandensis]MBP1977569.1 putative glyoxalase superfamily protein PhnB [Cohnella thailandensis]
MTVKLKRVSIFVEQMQRALDFYRMLGLEIPESANEKHHVDVEHNGLRLSFGTWESAQVMFDGHVEPAGYRMEIAFQFDSRDALDDLYRQMTEHGYIGHREPRDMPWGERFAIVKDPDGNLISLVA